MTGMSAFWVFSLLKQDGTSSDEACYAVIAGTDGSTVLAGVTEGDWEERVLDYKDFAALSLDADGKLMWRYQVSRFTRVDSRPGTRCLAVTGFLPDIGSIR